MHGAPEHGGDPHNAVGTHTTNPRPALRLLLVAALLVAITAAAGCQSRPDVVRVGQLAPAIEGTTLDGTPFRLEDLRGRPVVVNFWASWCGPCRDEFPLFQEQLARHESTGLTIVGVLYEDQADLAGAFATEFGMSWPTVLDPAAVHAGAYRVVAPPQSYFIDRAGVVRSIQIGEVREADFERQLAAITPER